MIKVDIATKIIDPQTSIWVMFPGRGRAFLNPFLGNSVVFLDTPALKLPPIAADDMPSIRMHVRMSLAVKAYQRGVNDARPPSRNVRNYPDGVFEDGADQVLATNVRKLFGKMRVGDLVVVPGRAYAPVYFGEVVAPYQLADVIQIERYGNEDIPVRRVRWLNRGVPRYEISQDLQVYLSKPPAIAKVARTFQTEEFFKLAYPAFVLADRSAVILSGPAYDGKHPLATYEANYLVSYFIAAFSAIESEKLDAFAGADLGEAIAQFFDTELVQSYSQNFNSPGKYGLTATSAVLGAFVSVAVALLLYAPSPEALKGDIEVTNSVSPSDSSIAKDAGIKLQYLFNALHKDQINEAIELARRAKENIGLKTPVQVEIEKK